MGALPDIRQERFAVEYVKCGIASRAALTAGYSEKTAHVQACRLLTRIGISKRIEELTRPINNKNIADIQELLEFWTRGVRGEASEVGYANQLKASELLGKAHRAFVDRVEMDMNVMVTFDSDSTVPD